MDRCIDRDSLIQSYVDNMQKYIHTTFPNIAESRITDFIKRTVETTIVRPQIDMLIYPSYGNIVNKKQDLLTVIKKYKNKIITPSGTIYESTDVQTATDKQFIDQLCSDRKKHKNLMFKHIIAGESALATLEDFRQALCKIKVNSLIGNNGCVYNAFYDLESFNGTTSLARHGVIMAYAFVEKFLVNNQYFPTVDKLINYIILTARHAPAKEVIQAVTDKHNLINPNAYEVGDSLFESMKPYVYDYLKYKPQIYDLLMHLPQHELTYIFYSRNLYNLFTENSEYFKYVINDIMTTTVDPSEITEAIDPNALSSVDGDLMCAISTIFTEKLGNDAISELPTVNKDKAREFYLLATKIQTKFDSIGDIIEVFLKGTELIQDIPCHRLMKRRTVAISDTDSVIFTTKDLIAWFLGDKFSINQDSFNIHAIIIYLMTKSLDSIIRLMTLSRGAVGDNVKAINMKNEFLYSIIIRTLLGKHYIGSVTTREGRKLKVPKLDMKGLAFKSSNIPECTHTYFKELVDSIITDICNNTTISINDYIIKILDYEKEIRLSLNRGELKFHSNISLKAKSEYKAPDASVYFNYKLWEFVFAEKYGSIHIPGKYTIVPFTRDLAKNKPYHDYLREKDPEIYKKLMTYLSRIDAKKKITRLPIAATLQEIPAILTPIIDTRKIMYKNMASTQLLMRGLGLDLGLSKHKPLLSDVYPVIDDDA